MKKSYVLVLLFFLLFISSTYADKTGSIKLLAVSGEDENQKGSIADLYLEIKEGTGRVFIDSFPLSKIDTQISTRFAKEVACNFLERDCNSYDFFYTIRANSAIVGGPSAGAAIAVLTISVLEDLPIDPKTTMTGTINTGGIIGPVGGVLPKIGAAAEVGIQKILIPKYSGLNESNISEYENNYSLKIVEVSQIEEALEEITGKKFTREENINISESYIETMGYISKEMCKRAEMLFYEVNITSSDINTEINVNMSFEYLKKGENSLNISEYYSAASYCFGSALNSQYSRLLKEKLDEDKIKETIIGTIDRVNEYKNFSSNKKLKTITDLETYMVVTDRLSEAKERLNDALFSIATNNTNASLYNLAYGIERLNSARSWAIFFDKPGRTYTLSKSALDDSCLKKISEVEERVQYIELYLPTGTEDIKKAIKESYDDYNNGEPELCLFKSSIAKAKINTVLNTMAIEIDELDTFIEDRSKSVKNVIAKQNKRDVFPILAYSYYEYANSLKKNDKYSGILYLEYALELGSLDIYFEKSKIPLPKLKREYFLFFLGGLFMGVLIGFIISKGKKKSR